MENPETGVEEFPKKHWGTTRVQQIVSMRLTAVAVQQIAARLPETEGRNLAGATQSALADWDGDLCPLRPTWPFPGPRPHWAALTAAAELSDLAATLPEDSSLRADIAASAGELAQQAARSMSFAGEARSLEASNGSPKLQSTGAYAS